MKTEETIHSIKKEIKDAVTIKTYTIKGSYVKTQEIQKKLVSHSQMPK